MEKRSKAMLAYFAVFRYLPILIIMLTAVLWRFLGPKPAVAIGCALFVLDMVVLFRLAARSGKRGGQDGPDGG
ncbi:MAG TPA: hypothetical protein VL426_07090 [Candidatus Binatia bacterium]|jgi:hypothetical protein|nr:hypothetical protein [Candidatus Binatia bacterium]